MIYTFMNVDNTIVSNDNNWSGSVLDSQYMQWVADGNITLGYTMPKPEPIQVTPLQFRLGLSRAGIRDNVESFVNSANMDIKDIYKYAAYFAEDNELIATYAKIYNIDAQTVHEIFLMMQTL